MNMAPAEVKHIDPSYRFAGFFPAFLSSFMLLYCGCHFPLAQRQPKSAPERVLSMNGCDSFRDSTSRQVFPESLHRARNHSANDIGPNAHGGSCPCCQSRSYQPKFPEFDRCSSPTMEACQFASFQQELPCPAPPPRHVDPQEYVYDGGDRDPQARLRQDLSVVGLDSEDTVIRFETEAGVTELQTGCRVPIYAPRFASARKITPVGIQDRAIAIEAALHDQVASQQSHILPPSNTRLRHGPIREEGVSVVEAVRDRNRGVPVDKILPAIHVSDAIRPLADLQDTVTIEQPSVERIKTQRATLSPHVWTSVEELVVLIDGVEAKRLEVSSRPEEVLTYELEGKPRIRLCKVASHQVAEPGDTIEFTIRFDNIGDQKVRNIVVHDSLAPRLEYVDGSQKTNKKADFTTEPNDAGSTVLTWKFSEEIKPGQGGYIRFQCKIR